MTQVLECPSCHRQCEVETMPASGVFTCGACGRSVVLRPSAFTASGEKELTRLLLDEELITPSQLEEARRLRDEAKDKGSPLPLAQILLDRQFLSQSQLEEVLGATGAAAVFIPGYEIIDKLGQGGMGTVYKGIHLGSGKTVAIKVLAARLGRRRDFVERFHREARVAIDLDHPHIVKGYDEGAVGHTHYFVMEHVEGKNAERVLRKRRRFGERRSMDIARQMASALDYAHGKGVVHRDVKPDNIILTRDGHARLADYGLVKMSDDEALLHLTASGQIMGTPHYISPEQVAGEHHIDIRCDIYGLGATLYHMITGTTPFSGKGGAEVMSMHLYGKLDDPRKRRKDLSEKSARIILKMMARNPEARYQTPAELLDDFNRYFGHEVAGEGGVREAGTDRLGAGVPEGGNEWLDTEAVRGGRDMRRREHWLLAGSVATLLLLFAFVALIAHGGPEAPVSEVWEAGEILEQTSKRLHRAQELEGIRRLATLQELAQDYPQTHAGWVARALLGGEFAEGALIPVDEAAAAVIYNHSQLVEGEERQQLLSQLAGRYPETDMGKKARETLELIEAERRAHARAQEEAARRREAAQTAKDREAARQRAAQAALDLAILLQDTPDRYLAKLREIIAAEEYAGTAAQEEARTLLGKAERQQKESARRARAAAEKEHAEAAYHEFTQNVIRCFVDNNPEAFGNLVQAFFADERLATVHDRARPYLEDWELLSHFNTSLMAGLEKYVGQKINVRMQRGGSLRGTLTEINNGVFKMAIAGTRVVERSIPDIEKEQKLILAREGFDGEEWQALIMTGLYRLMRADLKGGAAEFTAAAPKDPRHKHHRDLLEAVGGFESEFE